jgi:hypothetical protein
VRSPQRSREPGTKADRGIAVTVAVSKANVCRLTIRREFAGGRLREFVAVIPSRWKVAPQGSKSLGIADPLGGLRVETKRFVCGFNVTIYDDRNCGFGGKSEGDGCADSFGASGDENDFVFEFGGP